MRHMTTSTIVPDQTQNSAINNTPADYSAVHFDDEGKPYITEPYRNLSTSSQRYILALARLGEMDLAQRVAMCCRTGHVSKKCKHGHYAMAHRHHCGDCMCATDSVGSYRFTKWRIKRNPAIMQLPHEGLEVKFRTHKPSLTTHLKKIQALHTAAATLMRRLSPDSVRVSAFAVRIEDCAVRVVFPGNGQHSYMAIKRILDELGFDNLYAIIKRGTTEELFHWAFNGFRDLAIMDADAKAALRIQIIGHHTICTTGTLYHLLPREQWAKADSAPCVCPVCKDHDLDVVPVEERHVQRTEDITDAYDHVDWSREPLSPFVVRKGDITNNFGKFYRESSKVVDVDLSRPPW